MDHNSQGHGDFVFDIESCRYTNEEVGTPEALSRERLGSNFSAQVSGGLMNVDGWVDCENGPNVISIVANGSEGSSEDVKVLINSEVGVKAEDLVASRTRNETRKSTGSKKPPKPPRPPRGYSLDVADRKLIKEIAELAMLKRARIQRMKAVKKMKEAKALVSNSRCSFFSMFFSIIFFLVIVFQGSYCSSSSTSEFHGSPEASGAMEYLIIIQHRKSFATNGIYSTTSESPKLVEQISAMDPYIMLRKASG